MILILYMALCAWVVFVLGNSVVFLVLVDSWGAAEYTLSLMVSAIGLGLFKAPWAK